MRGGERCNQQMKNSYNAEKQKHEQLRQVAWNMRHHPETLPLFVRARGEPGNEAEHVTHAQKKSC